MIQPAPPRPPTDDLAESRGRGWARSWAQPLPILLTATAAFVGCFSVVNALRYSKFVAFHDLSIFEQTIYQTLKGNLLMNSHEGFYFGVHFSPVMLATLPFYALSPSAVTLLTITALALGLGGVALFFLARAAWGDEWAALLLSLAYLCHPVIHGMALGGYENLKFTIPLLFLFFWRLDAAKTWSSAILLFSLLLVREDVSMATALVGLQLMFFRRRWRTGAVVTLVSIAYFFAANAIISHYSGLPTEHGRFVHRYAHLGGSLTEVIEHTLRHPLRALSGAVDSPQKLRYLGGIFGPLLLTPVLGWEVLWIAFLPLYMNLQSKLLSQHLPFLHYSAGVVAIAFIAVVAGFNRRFLRTRPVWRRAAATALLLGCLAGVPAFWDFYRPGAVNPREFDWPQFDAADLQALRQLEQGIPANASLAASRSVVTHFAKRDKLLHLLISDQAVREGGYEYVLLDMKEPQFMDEEQLNGLVDLLAKDYRLIYRSPSQRIMLLRKRTGDPAQARAVETPA